MLKFFVLICNLLSLDCQDNGVVNGATASASNSTLSSNFTLIDSNSSSSIVSESIIDNNGYNQSYGHTGQSEAQNSTFPIAVDPLNSSLNSSNIAENIAASTNSTSTSTPPTTITTKPIFDDSIEELLDRLDTDNSTNSTSSKETTSSKFDPLIKCNEEPEPPMSTRSVDENEPIESTQIRKPDSTTTPATTTMASPRIVVDAKSTGIFNSTKSFARR
uniref:Uncharacterized protein n=2 Tax=Bursaphelenchus xylophilus TaxID=6326 RepID=A0A1I7SIY5_BURXY